MISVLGIMYLGMLSVAIAMSLSTVHTPCFLTRCKAYVQAVYFDVLCALDKASLAVLQIAKFAPIYMAPTPQNQGTLWPTPHFASLPNEAPIFLQDAVSLCAFSGDMLAVHVAKIDENLSCAPLPHPSPCKAAVATVPHEGQMQHSIPSESH
jgi:hypothetical protein